MGTATLTTQANGESVMWGSGVECAKATAGFTDWPGETSGGMCPSSLIQMLFQKCHWDFEMLWMRDKTVHVGQ